MSETTITFSNVDTEAISASTRSSFLSVSLLGFALSALVVVLGAAVWGSLAAFTGNVFFIVPLVIGFLVASALLLPFDRVPFLLGAIFLVFCIALTIASTILGDFIFYTILAMREFDFTLFQAVPAVAEHFIALMMGARETLVSIILAVIGAVIGFGNAVRS